MINDDNDHEIVAIWVVIQNKQILEHCSVKFHALICSFPLFSISVFLWRV